MLYMWKYILKQLCISTYSSFIRGFWSTSCCDVQLCVCDVNPNADLVVASMFIKKGNDGSYVVFLDDI